MGAGFDAVKGMKAPKLTIRLRQTAHKGSVNPGCSHVPKCMNRRRLDANSSIVRREWIGGGKEKIALGR